MLGNQMVSSGYLAEIRSTDKLKGKGFSNFDVRDRPES